MLNIAILGCGYVGTALATYWKKKGHHISATTRSHSKVKSLKPICQNVTILYSDDQTALTNFLKHQDVIVVTIAADHVQDYANAYLKTAHTLKKVLAKLPAKTLIYTSSTFVYGDHDGSWVDEQADLLTQTEQGKILIETEKVYQSLQSLGWNILIFRLSEIYGPNRELSTRVKTYLDAPLAGSGEKYSNMIHLDDIVSAIDYALSHSLQGTFNLADDDHPTRKELYDQVSEAFHLPKVTFDPKVKTMRSDNKRISNHTIKAAGYSFIVPDRKLE